jgi:hypothetical protein
VILFGTKGIVKGVASTGAVRAISCPDPSTLSIWDSTSESNDLVLLRPRIFGHLTSERGRELQTFVACYEGPHGGAHLTRIPGANGFLGEVWINERG